MTQELNGWLILFAGGSGVVLWWIWRSYAAKIDSLQREFAAYQVHCAETYVTHNSFERALENLTKAVFARLDRIEDKLDGKVPKS